MVLVNKEVHKGVRVHRVVDEPLLQLGPKGIKVIRQ